MTTPTVRLCTVDGCDAELKARGYCNRHYLQVVFYGQEPTPLRRHPTTRRDDNGHKQCVTCKNWMHVSKFHRAKNCKDGFASTCSICYRTKYADKQIQNHGLTKSDYDTLFAKQHGRCICGSSTGPFVVDHDHACCPGNHGCPECVRGILCQPCNKTLGFSRDDPQILRQLAEYLERNKGTP